MRQLGEEELTVKRFGVGAYVAGDFVPGAITELTILGTIRPVGRGYELERLPEGVRSRASHYLFQNTNLGSPNAEPLKLTGRAGSGQLSDRVSYDGGTGLQDLEVLAIVDNDQPFGSLVTTTLHHREYILGAPEETPDTVS